MITVQINGDSHAFDAPLKVTEVISYLALVGKKVAIERNGELVPRSQYSSSDVLDGDKLEIVIAVGGG